MRLGSGRMLLSSEEESHFWVWRISKRNRSAVRLRVSGDSYERLSGFRIESCDLLSTTQPPLPGLDTSFSHPTSPSELNTRPRHHLQHIKHPNILPPDLTRRTPHQTRAPLPRHQTPNTPTTRWLQSRWEASTKTSSKPTSKCPRAGSPTGIASHSKPTSQPPNTPEINSPSSKRNSSLLPMASRSNSPTITRLSCRRRLES